MNKPTCLHNTQVCFNNKKDIEFKHTGVGVIPNGWQLKTIGTVANFSGGSQPPRSVFIFNAKSGYIRLIQIRDYKSDDYETYIPQVMAQKFCGLDDIMIGRYGPPIFQILRGLEGAYNVALIKAIPQQIILKEYLYYFLKSDTLFNFIESLSQRSSGQTGIEMDALKNYPIALPPLPEQQAIAKALSDIDALINAIEALITKKRNIKQGAMQQLLTGKMRLPGFSGEWQSYTFGDLFEFLTTANNSRADLSNNCDTKYIHYGDIHTEWNNFLDFSANTIPTISSLKIKGATFLKDGDLIVADASEDYEGIAKSVEVIGLRNQKAIAGLHTFLLRAKHDTIVNGYISPPLPCYVL